MPDIFVLTINKKESRNLKVILDYEGPVKAPIKKDSKIAELKILNNENLIQSTPIYALKETPKVNFLNSLFTSINYLIWGDV